MKVCTKKHSFWLNLFKNTQTFNYQLIFNWKRKKEPLGGNDSVTNKPYGKGRAQEFAEPPREGRKSVKKEVHKAKKEKKIKSYDDIYKTKWGPETLDTTLYSSTSYSSPPPSLSKSSLTHRLYAALIGHRHSHSLTTLLCRLYIYYYDSGKYYYIV